MLLVRSMAHYIERSSVRCDWVASFVDHGYDARRALYADPLFLDVVIMCWTSTAKTSLTYLVRACVPLLCGPITQTCPTSVRVGGSLDFVPVGAKRPNTNMRSAVKYHACIVFVTLLHGLWIPFGSCLGLDGILTGY